MHLPGGSGEDEAVPGTGKLGECEVLPEELFVKQSGGLRSILGVRKRKSWWLECWPLGCLQAPALGSANQTPAGSPWGRGREGGHLLTSCWEFS